MYKIDNVQKLAQIFSQSRNIAGVSQDFMAMGLGVSRLTISNWERGTSSPSIQQAFQWFQILGQNPMRPFLEFLYPNTFSEEISEEDEEGLRKALADCLMGMPPKVLKQLLYIFNGEHGSSPISIMQMITAHLHTTIRARTLVAQLISDNYELCEKCGEIVCEDNVRPDIELLDKSIALGKEATVNGHAGYISY